MCEGYWDKRLGRWVSLEELEEQAVDSLVIEDVKLPSPAPAEPRRKPAAMMR